MAMAPYVYIDFGSRIKALRDVGLELGLPQSSIPDQSASNSQRTYLRWINIYRVAMSLTPLPTLDYSGFVPALNVLAALTGGTLRPEVITAPVVSGLTTLGATLTSTNGTWSNTPTSYTYQWQRDNVNIAGQTAATHVIVSADQGGHELSCLVTAVNAGGNSTPSQSNLIVVP
jgi:hypothetical protein